MSDKREQVLVRLLAIAETVDDITTAKRNAKRPSDDAFDAIIIVDADETAEETDPSGRPSHAPRRVGMTPEIYILAAGKSEAVGTRVNLLRARFVKAVMTDTELKTILGTNGEIRYEGCLTALSWGREMIGDMGVSFTFLYILQPDKLTD